MLKKNYKIILILLATLALVVVFLSQVKDEKHPRSQVLGSPRQEESSTKTEARPDRSPEDISHLSEKNNEHVDSDNATLVIESRSYQDEISAGTSVYDFMDKVRLAGKIDFKEKNYTGLGKFIYEINGVSNAGTKNWIYYVNGEKAWIGVTSYKLKPGDVVSWKFEEEY